MLIKKLNKWLEGSGLTATVDLSDEFYADTDSEIIYIPEKFSICEIDNQFYDFGVSQGLPGDCGIATFSFLHELGHVMMDDIWDEEDWDNFQKQKELLSEMDDQQEANSLYFMIDDEYNATHWAIDFIKNNEITYKKLQKLLDNL